MATFAVISDIHANLEALTAVLESIDSLGIEEVCCLGDIVGYGPDPAACLDLVRERCAKIVCGNHDEAVLKGPWGFSALARDAMEWTRRRLRPGVLRVGSRSRWGFLTRLPPTLHHHGYLLAHGSPRQPTSEYVLPHHVAWPQPGMFEEIFDSFDSVCFVGHTHVAGVFDETPRFRPQAEIDGPFRSEGSKLLINVGSVGQPRDKDWRACYVTTRDGTFEFHRVEYPLEITRRKILANEDLDNRLADRLLTGD